MISLLVSGQFCKKMGNSTCCQNLINCEKINTPPFGAQKGGHQNLSLNFDFRGHILTFRAENTAKSGLFKVKNNANTTSEQPQTKKSPKNDFFGPKNGQIVGTNFGKKYRILVIFWTLNL